MESYLVDTRYAAESLINAYVSGLDELNTAIERFNVKVAEFEPYSGDIIPAQDLERSREAIARFQEARRLQIEVFKAKAVLQNRQTATAALCGGLFQMAKQGISTVHGGPGAGPGGRLIGTQPIKTIIWQTRNQGMHWEETGPLRADVENCFATLDADLRTTLRPLIKTKNLSAEVVGILGWTTYEAYEKDMLSLR